jgi:hypothetical protein
MSTPKNSTDQLSQTAETQESGLPETECAERTVTESDPYSYYCPECRATYDFPWLKAQDCTCQPMHDFIVQHNASHDTKRLQVNTSVNTPARESAVPLRGDLPLADFRTRIIAAIAKADQDWCSDTPLHEDMADAVIAELDRR